jgi:hypothetical protein
MMEDGYMKGMSKASYVLGVEIHRICFEIFFLWKAANLSCTFDKRELLLFEEFELVRKNNCHPIIILGHYSYDLMLAMPFEIFLF